jgi:hypothetical protein
MEIVIPRRFRGPSTSGNGGYTCGKIAAAIGGDVEVTLRLPPPLDTPLRVDQEGRVWDEEVLVAETTPAEVDLDPPEPVSWDEAVAAQAPDLDSPFPECFVCGHARGDDGLHIHAGPVAGRAVVAASWVPQADTASAENVWAALDCPGAYAVMQHGRGMVVLGRLAARIERLPEPGERCVTVGWALGSDGRKHGAGTAVFTVEGELIGIGRATWIEPR